MKWALITDIHANRQAFEAVLADARAKGAEHFALLGDFVGYGPDPAWVIDQVRALLADGAVAVQGNHDAAVAAGSSPQMHQDARDVVDWTRAQLSGPQLDLLATLPLSVSRRCGAADCLFVHANAFRPAEWDYISGRSEAMRSLQASVARLQFCGHMHEPMLYNLSGTGKAGEFKPVSGMAIPLAMHRQWLAIPGSCGQPRDGNPAACYALFEPSESSLGDARLTFERVPYDVEATANALRESALPPALAERLARRLLIGE
jgi:diadenosine tetraphosphatase ApaH/serine/threonine PP2A family protein phosphatase